MGIAHRDIKPENLLIDDKGRLLIGDFGFACDALDLNRSSIILLEKIKNVGSEEYNAPELFDQNDKTYDGAKADIFSAGVTLFLMLTKCPPFRAANSKDPYFRRLSGLDKKAFWKIFNGIDIEDQVKDLFECMTDKDPISRLDIQCVKEHLWYKGNILPKAELVTDIEARS